MDCWVGVEGEAGSDGGESASSSHELEMRLDVPGLVDEIESDFNDGSIEPVALDALAAILNCKRGLYRKLMTEVTLC